MEWRSYELAEAIENDGDTCHWETEIDVYGKWSEEEGRESESGSGWVPTLFPQMVFFQFQCLLMIRYRWGRRDEASYLS